MAYAESLFRLVGSSGSLGAQVRGARATGEVATESGSQEGTEDNLSTAFML